jgi:hypothetical protein
MIHEDFWGSFPIEQSDKLTPIEIKSGQTLNSDYFTGLVQWKNLAGSMDGESWLVYGRNSIMADFVKSTHWGDCLETSRRNEIIAFAVGQIVNETKERGLGEIKNPNHIEVGQAAALPDDRVLLDILNWSGPARRNITSISQPLLSQHRSLSKLLEVSDDTDHGQKEWVDFFLSRHGSHPAAGW